MIVDLVRNDLSRCAERNSVEVEELFGVHTFKTVHHLISTIRCDIPSEISLVDLLRASFPMGSMTGAPKVSAMQLIAQHEITERGAFPS
jgi:para-aminobenzoate synthetase component 1